MDAHSLLVYTGIVTLLVLTPGPNAALILRTAGFRGRLAGFGNLAGIVSGFYFHATCSALGLSVILLKSPELYFAVKVAGAAYLIYLGVKTLRQVWREKSQTDSAKKQELPLDAKGAFIEGLLTNVFNPKVALFYLALLPQFIHNKNSVLFESLVMATIHAIIAGIWFTLLTVLFGRFGQYVGSSKLKHRLQSLTGMAFIGLGIKIALDGK
jgi:threonine/homoserine/homoserine lactone efflux protein